MQKITASMLIDKACELLANHTVERVLGWKIGEFAYDVTPALFTSVEDLKNNFVFGDFCGANLSKYLMKEIRKGEGRVLAFLKPCDTYSFNQLVTEHHIDREKTYIVGIPCEGMADIELIKKTADGIVKIDADGEELNIETLYDGVKKVKFADVMAERCRVCKSKKHTAYDELIGEDGEVLTSQRFDEVEKLEKMTPDERFAFWQNELSRCIRCNACRNVCPACTCEKCVFDNPDSGVENKAISDSFEEKMFHIIRAFHVAGRCTDCGECSRVCPQSIPLHLLNRKFIKDINSFYGDYQAGAVVGSRAPLVNYTLDDMEPSEALAKGENDNA